MRNIPTELVLLQIAEGLQSLVQNKDLSSIIKEAYTLSEAEKFKAEQAKKLISEADGIRAELKAREEALGVIDARIDEAEKLESFNEDTLAEIRKQQKDLIAQANKNVADAEANKATLRDIDKRNNDLDDREIAISENEKESDAIKADLQKRLNAVKAAAA